MLDVAPVPSDAGPQQVAKSAPEDHHVAFHDVLSALNPLQYLPVIGTIYRAVTGDQIPEAVRRIGSLVVSGLLGGPIGVAVNLAVMVAEKLTGVDLDQTGQKLLAGSAPAARPADNPAPASGPVPVVHADTAAPPASAPSQPWSPAQLAAYGVTTTGDSMLKLANLTGADVLNALELLRIQGARAAYGRTANLAG
ncbi:MAG TPA: hypothetical protein VK741_26830 [Acetobacteraceae bacterium]|jgi:hypothetical protein|nr:hypothetical protein [Acetobacteraceae bacterium]